MSTSRARSDADGGGAGASGMSALRPRPSAGRLSTMLLLLGRGRRGGAREHFAREREVGFGPLRLCVVKYGRHAVARRLAETNVAGNDGGVDPIDEERPDVARHLLPQIRALVVHRQKHAGDIERGIERGADTAQGGDEV